MTDTIRSDPAKSPEIIEIVERPAAVVRIDATLAEFPGLIGEAFGLSAQAIAASGATIAGPPFARYLSFGERIEAEAGFPFVGTLVPTDRVGQPARRPGRDGDPRWALRRDRAGVGADHGLARGAGARGRRATVGSLPDRPRGTGYARHGDRLSNPLTARRQARHRNRLPDPPIPVPAATRAAFARPRAPPCAVSELLARAFALPRDAPGAVGDAA
jgi:hypothetical protein